MVKFARLVDSLNRPTVTFKTSFVKELTTAVVRGIRVLLTCEGYRVRTSSERDSIDHIVDLLSKYDDGEAVKVVKYLTALYMPIVGKDDQMPERPPFLAEGSTLFTHEYGRFIKRIFANHYRTTRRQISLAMSILQLKRYMPALPESLRSQARVDLKKRLTSPAKTSHRLLDELARTANELFPLGWDRGPIPTYAVTNKSCLESTKANGGAQAYQFDDNGMSSYRFEQCPIQPTDYVPMHPNVRDPSTYMEYAINHQPSVLKAKVEIVEDPLKARVITKNNWHCTVLKPLQKMIHGRLRKHEAFRLIGTPISEDVINDITLFPGAKYVSGDYSAATDNLHSDVTETIIDVILGNMKGRFSRSPEFIMLARRSLTGLTIVDDELGEYKMERGQLMGSLLSFPILCIANFAIWRHATELTHGVSCDGLGKGGRFDRVLINGDDIGFAATSPQYQRWKSLVPQVGLEPSLGKNYYSSEFITLNTRVYSWSETEHKLKEVKFLNLGLLCQNAKDNNLERLESLGVMHDDFVRGAEYKGIASQIFICSWKSLLKQTFRNLFGPREHGGLGAHPVAGSHGTTYEGYNVRQMIIAQYLKEGKARLPSKGRVYRYAKFQQAYVRRVFPCMSEAFDENELPKCEGYYWRNITELVGEAQASFRSMVSWLAPYNGIEKLEWDLWNRIKMETSGKKVRKMKLEEYLSEPLHRHLWTLTEAWREGLDAAPWELDLFFV